MKAIVYNSNTGYTKMYAEKLSSILNIPAVEFKLAQKELKGQEVIFMSWIMGGLINKLNKAEDRFSVKVICAVGFSSKTPELEQKIKSDNKITKDFYYLPGGFDLKKLKGIYKIMMNLMVKASGKQNENSQVNPTMADELIRGGNKVDFSLLNAISHK